jgi:hypothetical protein
MDRKTNLDADKMLRQLYNSARKVAAYSRMSNSDGVIYSRYSGAKIASILAEHGLVEDESFFDSGCDVLTITSKGKKVQNEGGFIAYLERLNNELRNMPADYVKTKMSGWLFKYS